MLIKRDKISFNIRPATATDMDEVMKIQQEMYGEGYTRETFEKCLSHFPQGFVLAEPKEEERGEIVGFVVTERIDKIMAIPYVHDPADYINPKGDIIYLSGFGVKSNYQEKGLGVLLYKEVIKVAKRLGIKKFEVLCNEQDPEDQYEMSILRKLGFHKGEALDWEIYPNKIHPHTAWIKETI